MSAADTAEIPVPRDYALRGVAIDPAWRVLDVGPGGFPLPGANVWHLDHDRVSLARFPADRAVLADLDLLPLPFAAGEFDFVWCSHVLEHVADPDAVAAELARVGRRGVLVVPHCFKDAMFCFEEPTHRWWFLPPAAPGRPPRCLPADPAFMAALRETEAQKALCRLYRSDPQVSYDHATLHAWLLPRAEYLDIVVPWVGTLGVEVLG
jgi:SAM-dependent methyltransferase